MADAGIERIRVAGGDLDEERDGEQGEGGEYGLNGINRSADRW